MSESKVKKIKLSDLIPDPNNANKGTERGRYMLEKSLQELGAGRSILVDSRNVTIAGNKTLETAVESGFENAIVIETDGSEIVVVRRTDLNLDTDEKAKKLAIADNRTSQVSLNWSIDVLLELEKEVDLSGFFSDGELQFIADNQDNQLIDEVKDKSEKEKKYTVVVECSDEIEQGEVFNNLVAQGLKCKVRSR
ncbi:hypothetical protein PCC6912_50950 [Chlorogloeopsis fritschii PCC 6912]|uniref:ParB/Sulfiredoxin domain-containing protein n=1 Tax=Chlorogloeopsis fritschii PCC 6912 TaxID=211165 RepID=A0A3S0ZPY9_CHLFR|nr:hypothetical protein [Chlorogloeopsis fritschii]RUR74917.1 hypothetical protein PCC6912_50950 [Chlorogloeopsis fritschii PCC 6912]